MDTVLNYFKDAVHEKKGISKTSKFIFLLTTNSVNTQNITEKFNIKSILTVQWRLNERILLCNF